MSELFKSKTMQILHHSRELEKLLEHEKYLNEIPYINFPSEWKVQIIFPFMGAYGRFMIKGESPDRSVSVYLDTQQILGLFNGPYWEIYPDKENDTARFALNDVDGLLKAIKESLENQ